MVFYLSLIFSAVFIFIIKEIVDNYSKKNSISKISKYTFANSGVRMLLISIILLTYSYIITTDLKPIAGDWGTYSFPIIEVSFIPFLITTIWLIDYKLRDALINYKIINIALIFEIILALAIYIPFLKFAQIIILLQIYPLVMLFAIYKLSNSAINNYPTDKQSVILTDEIDIIKRLRYPSMMILLLFIISIVLAFLLRYYVYLQIFIFCSFINSIIAIFIILKMDKSFMQLVYFQQNTSKYILLSSCIVLWLFLPSVIGSLVIIFL